MSPSLLERVALDRELASLAGEFGMPPAGVQGDGIAELREGLAAKYPDASAREQFVASAEFTAMTAPTRRLVVFCFAELAVRDNNAEEADDGA